MNKNALVWLMIVLALSITLLQGCGRGFSSGSFGKSMHKCADCGDELFMKGSTKDHEICPVTTEPHNWRYNL